MTRKIFFLMFVWVYTIVSVVSAVVSGGVGTENIKYTKLSNVIYVHSHKGNIQYGSSSISEH